MAAAAVLEQEPQLRAIDVATMEGDPALRLRAAEFVGQCIANQSFGFDSKDDLLEKKPQRSLYQAIIDARNGNKKAFETVVMNVLTDDFERTHKYGIIMEVDMSLAEDGTVLQGEQTLDDNTRNTLTVLTNQKLRERAKGPEAQNVVRIQELARKGLLKDNYLVTSSLVHHAMDDTEADKEGFFSRYRSLSLQIISEQEGELKVYSIFVAGREGPHEASFDIDAIREFARQLGASYDDLDTEEILGRPLLVPKSLLQHGAASVAFRYDQAARVVTRKIKYFGRDSDKSSSEADYVRKQEQDFEAMSGAKERAMETAKKLIASSVSNMSEATTKLAELNEEQLKQRILYDESIDANVLGEKVAWQVNHARYLRSQMTNLDWQNNELLRREIDILQRYINKNGQSSSCPGGATTEEKDSFGNDVEDSGTIKLEDCEFVSKECPKCGEKNVKTTVKDGVYYGACKMKCRSDK